MKVFEIEVLEILSRIIEVKQEDLDASLQTVKRMYKNEEIVLTESDFQEVRFIDVNQCSNVERDACIIDVLHYLYETEKKHFEEVGANKDNHIFLKLEKLKHFYDVGHI